MSEISPQLDLMSEYCATPTIFRKAAVFGLAVFALTGCGGNIPQEHGLDTTTSSSEEVVALNSALIPMKEFMKELTITDEQIKDLKDATLQLRTKAMTCTAMIISNMIAISAAHCLSERPEQQNGDDIELYTWQDHFKEPAAKIHKWGYSKNGDDILIGLISAFHKTVSTWETGEFDNQDPEPGTRFIVCSLPGDSGSPWWSTLTFLGRDNARRRGKLVFAVDPGVNQEVASGVARPGASGSLITDADKSVSVLWGSTGPINRDGSNNENWSQVRDYYQTKFGVDLGATTQIIFGSPATGDGVERLTAVAET